MQIKVFSGLECSGPVFLDKKAAAPIKGCRFLQWGGHQLFCGISPLARRLLISAMTSGKSVIVSIM